MTRRSLFAFVFAAACLLPPACVAQEIGAPAGATRKPIAFSQSCPGSDKMVGIDGDGNIVCAGDQTGGGGVPAGAVVLVTSGSCSATLGAGWSEVSSLNGKFVLGTVATNGDIAGTGGSDTVTPAGAVSQPSFTGTPFTEVISHTHAVNINDPGHAHGQQVRNTSTAGTAGTQGANTANNATAGTTVSATTGISATTSPPAGGVSSITPAGTVSQPAFTGTAFDNRPAFVKVIFCKKD